MLENNTAYRITPDNAHTLSIISGILPKIVDANAGWYAAYSERWMPRWKILPSRAVRDEGFLKREEDAFNPNR